MITALKSSFCIINTMHTQQVQTQDKWQIVDITDQVQKAITNDQGIATIFVRHTTAALTTADLDPGTDVDFLDFLHSLVPSLQWRHPHNPEHAPDHLLTSVIGTSVTVPYINNTLQLGTWQRIVLIEFDGPRERKLIIAEAASN